MRWDYLSLWELRHRKPDFFVIQVCETAESSICFFTDSPLVPGSLNHPSHVSFFPLAFPPCFFKVNLTSSWMSSIRGEGGGGEAPRPYQKVKSVLHCYSLKRAKARCSCLSLGFVWSCYFTGTTAWFLDCRSRPAPAWPRFRPVTWRWNPPVSIAEPLGHQPSFATHYSLFDMAEKALEVADNVLLGGSMYLTFSVGMSLKMK